MFGLVSAQRLNRFVMTRFKQKPSQSERDYMARMSRLMREGAIRNAFRWVSSGFGLVAGLAWLLMAGGTYLTFLRLGGSGDDWRFLFGFAVGSLLCPGLFIFGIGTARLLKDAESTDTRPFTLMVKYHDHLVREDLDPYEENKVHGAR
jgi:hypothetical protein